MISSELAGEHYSWTLMKKNKGVELPSILQPFRWCIHMKVRILINLTIHQDTLTLVVMWPAPWEAVDGRSTGWCCRRTDATNRNSSQAGTSWKCDPILFINKVDRLINELKLTPADMQMRLGLVIDKVNKIVKGLKPDSYDKLKLDPAIGRLLSDQPLITGRSAFHIWKRPVIGFKDIIELCQAEKQNELAVKCPLHVVMNDMIIRFLPSPVEAQRERIKVIWHGDKESDIGKSMINVDRNGKIALMITISQQTACRWSCKRTTFFRYTWKRQGNFYFRNANANRIQSVGLFHGPERIRVVIKSSREYRKQ